MDTVVIFTSKNLDTFLQEGGSGHWVASRNRLAKCTYIVAAANAHSSWSSHSEDTHAHAFLVGKITGAVEATTAAGRPNRLIIQFDEFALVNIPNAWGGQRNPVRYTDISEFGINPADLDWQPFPRDRIKKVDSTNPLTMEEAKKGLAKQLGVSPDCVEITIRA